MSTMVIAVGNSLRSEDGIGHVIGDQVKDIATVRHSSGDPVEIIEWLGESDDVVIVDAVVSGAAPGTLHRIDAVAEPVPQHLFRRSTHLLGVGEAVEMARTLGRLPQRLTLIGVEVTNFRQGVGLEPTAAGALEDAVAAVKEVIGNA